MDTQLQPEPARPNAFAQTRWSLVAAARDGDAEIARHSLWSLCSAYWYPVYAYIRRCGHSADLAYDLAESFFSDLAQDLRVSDPRSQGRFRSYLLSRLSQFLAADWRQESRDAGSGMSAPLSRAELEARHRQERLAETTPERAFQRSFAMEVLSQALRRLRLEAEQSGRLALFEQLEAYLTREPEAGQYQAMEQALGIRALALVVSLKRLRQRFRELVDEELAQTVSNAPELARERAALLVILGGGHD